MGDEIISSRMAQVQLDENGLVVPKKLFNPCTDSRECQNLHREIRWNAKAGIDVLNTKSELERAMEKRKRNRKEQEQQASKTPFQKMLEDRAKRLEKIESRTNSDGSEDSGHCSPEPESEFLKVHAQLRGRTTLKKKKKFFFWKKCIVTKKILSHILLAVCVFTRN